MRIAALRDDFRACRTLRLALRAAEARPHAARGGASLHFCVSWEEVLDRAEAGLVDVAVVDPTFGWPERAPPGAPFLELERFRSVLGAERIVLLVHTDAHAPILLRELSRAGFPFRLGVGTGDDPATVLRILARVGAHLVVREWSRRLEGRLGEEALELLLDVARTWPPPATVQGLARRLHRSPATLRRHLRALRLPPPGWLLAWLHLLEAVRLRDLGVSGRTALADVLGYEEPATLSRLARRVAGVPLGEVLESSKAGELLVAALAQAAGA